MTAALLTAALLVATAVPSAPDASPGKQVETLLLAQAEAWNRGDMAAFCSVYVDDTLFVTPSGVTRGRKAVQERYEKRYPDAATRGTLSFEFIEVKAFPEGAAKPAAVSLAARWKITYQEKEKPPAQGYTLLTFRPRGDSWAIVQDASM